MNGEIFKIKDEEHAHYVRSQCRKMKFGRPLPVGFLRDADLMARDRLFSSRLERQKRATGGIVAAVAKVRRAVAGSHKKTERGWLTRFLGRRTQSAA